jgi:hypothetical protein
MIIEDLSTHLQTADALRHPHLWRHLRVYLGGCQGGCQALG